MELEARLLAEAQKRLADAARQQAGSRAAGSPSAAAGQSGSQGARPSNGASGGGTASEEAIAGSRRSRNRWRRVPRRSRSSCRR
jgi:hypothetical protein